MAEFPRRNRIDQYTPAEKAIHEAIQAVEKAGAHPRLTDAVNLLGDAREAVADFVDRVPAPSDPSLDLDRDAVAYGKCFDDWYDGYLIWCKKHHAKPFDGPAAREGWNAGIRFYAGRLRSQGGSREEAEYMADAIAHRPREEGKGLAGSADASPMLVDDPRIAKALGIINEWADDEARPAGEAFDILMQVREVIETPSPLPPSSSHPAAPAPTPGSALPYGSNSWAIVYKDGSWREVSFKALAEYTNDPDFLVAIPTAPTHQEGKP